MDEKSLHSDVSPTQHKILKPLHWINLWRFMKREDREGEQEDIFAMKGDQKYPVWLKHKLSEIKPVLQFRLSYTPVSRRWTPQETLKYLWRTQTQHRDHPLSSTVLYLDK